MVENLSREMLGFWLFYLQPHRVDKQVQIPSLRCVLNCLTPVRAKNATATQAGVSFGRSHHQATATAADLRDRGVAPARVGGSVNALGGNVRTSYMPNKQNEAVDWSANFAEKVGKSPADYGLTAAQGSAFLAVDATLQAAWAATRDPGTKNKVSVANKDAALLAMKAMARNLVSVVQGTPGVTDAMKLDLGVTVRSTTATRIDPPKTRPFIKGLRIDGRTAIVELGQADGVRGKPAKVAGATIFTHLGPVAPASRGEWMFAMSATRTTVELPCPASATGDTLWVTAFWTNAKGQAGPACDPTSINLPAGGVLPQEMAQTTTMKIAA